MNILIIVISIYLSLGLTWLAEDKKQPNYNKPAYLRSGSILKNYSVLFTWPVALYFNLPMGKKYIFKRFTSNIGKIIFYSLILFVVIKIIVAIL